MDTKSRRRAKDLRLLASKEKKLFWIENTTKRFKDGYNYFGRYPEKVIAFFDKHMKSSAGATREKGATGARVSL